MSDLAYSLLMMGPVGVPLECFTDASPDDSWWSEPKTIKAGRRYRVVDDAPWTVERIGRRVYTFSLDGPETALKGKP